MIEKKERNLYYIIDLCVFSSFVYIVKSIKLDVFFFIYRFITKIFTVFPNFRMVFSYNDNCYFHCKIVLC